MSTINYREVTREDYLGYLCGFVATDGCLSKSQNSITIKLSSKDHLVLKWILDVVQSNPKEIKYSSRETNKTKKPSEMACISFTNPKFFQYCLDMGITPNKTYTLDVKLNDKSEVFKWFFLRGVIDGDGSIHVNPDKPGTSKIRIYSASGKFLETINDIFGGSIQNAPGATKVLNFSGALAQKIAKNLPKDTFCLTRKTLQLEELIKLKLITNNSIRTSTKVGNIWNFTFEETLLATYKKSNCPVSYRSFVRRIRKGGMTIEEALTCPPKGLKE